MILATLSYAQQLIYCQHHIYNIDPLYQDLEGKQNVGNIRKALIFKSLNLQSWQFHTKKTAYLIHNVIHLLKQESNNEKVYNSLNNKLNVM